MFLILCAFCLMVVLSRLDSDAYSAQCPTMSLVCVFMAVFALALGTMHPEQPVSLTMDMVSFAHHDGGVPALALVEFAATPERPGLLVPIHVRVGMGMLGLWLTMIAAALVGLASVNHQGREKQSRMIGHWCVTLLGLVVFGAWLKTVSSTFSESEFARYLTEFDLAEIARIEYPTTPWAVALPIPLVTVVSTLFGLSLIFLKPLKLPLTLDARILNIGQRVISLLILGWCIYSLTLPLGLAARWSGLCCGLFVTISYIDPRGAVRVWFVLGTAISALMHWAVL
ncbi:MAG: hypothetical protein ACPGQS_03985 [Bradymonadia bacterium]